MSRRTITRRDFLKAASVTPLAGALVPALKGLQAAQTDKVKVVLIRDPSALDASGSPDPAVVFRMLDEAVCAISGRTDALTGWKTLIRPEDIVGIKTNAWGKLPTTSAVEQALRRRVLDAGVPDDKVGIDDRGVLRNPVFQNATALLNARPARTHHWSGMGSCLKNYIQFVPRPSDYHPDTCADLGEIWTKTIVKGKTRLNVLVMFTPLFHGIGPSHFSKAYTWPYNGLIVSRDPVAADATGLRVLEAKRREHFKEDRPLQPTPHHIFLADTRHHVGVSSPDRIELVKLGWTDGALI